MRSVFGWSLPPGCTDRMIEEAYGVDEVCDVCCKGVEDCICPECKVCEEQGNIKCYEAKSCGLKLSKAQVVSRQQCRIRIMKEQVQDEEMALVSIEAADQTEWDLAETMDPWA